MAKTISLPESLADMFEEFATAHEVKVECVGTGCGSTEYDVESDNIHDTLSTFGE